MRDFGNRRGVLVNEKEAVGEKKWRRMGRSASLEGVDIMFLRQRAEMFARFVVG